MRTHIDPDNQDDVVWLQLALAKLLGGIGAFHETGRMSAPTGKALRFYQVKHGLPVTGEADEITLQHIQQNLGS